MVEREITEPVDECLADGRLDPDAVGWSRVPLHRCNLRGHWPRKKRWEYWCVTSDTHLVSVTYADIDYLGLIGVWFLDYASGRTASKNLVVPFGIGFSQPETVGGADISWSGLGLDLAMTETSAATRLCASFRDVDMDIDIGKPPGHESLNVLVPWSDSRFQFTSKQNTRPAVGYARIGQRRYEFGMENSSYGTLDFGRGVWPYRVIWNWGSGSGRSNGRIVGLQLGGKWTDATGSTENGVVVDGTIHKICDDLTWEYDQGDFMKVWRVHDPTGRKVDLEFDPFYERTDGIDLGVLFSEAHQCFGRWTGLATGDDGFRVEVEGLLGWAEEFRGRW